MAFLERHGRLGLPLTAQVVVGYKQQAPGHLPTPKQPLELAGYEALLDHLEQGSQWEKYAAALVLRILLSCLRPAHFARTSRVAQDCTLRTTVWQVSRGKSGNRAAFKLAVPTHVAAGLCYERVLADETKGKKAHDLILPDLVAGRQGLRGPCKATDRTMGRSKFLGLAASFVGKLHPTRVTGYTFRRWLASVVGGLKLPIERRKDLGNWADCVDDKEAKRAPEPMAVRYSGQRL